MKISAASLIVVATFSLLSCATQTVPQPETPVQGNGTTQTATEASAQTEATTDTSRPGTDAATSDSGEIVAQFENVKITKENFQATKRQLEIVVNDLNRITFSRDYNGWLSYLSPEYLQTFSDPATLAEVSASLPIKGVQLKSIKDYFNYVFVPSRQNMRVDDIKYVSPTRVYVIMEISPGNPAAIYIIEKFGEDWKLVPKNQ